MIDVTEPSAALAVDSDAASPPPVSLIVRRRSVFTPGLLHEKSDRKRTLANVFITFK